MRLIQSISESVKRERKQVAYTYAMPQLPPKVPVRRKKSVPKKPGHKAPSAKRIKLDHPQDRTFETQSGNDDSDNDQLFCLCRRPDDHSVMLGCDGPCKDWFHLKCVGMTPALVKLVYKWYCGYRDHPLSSSQSLDQADAGPNCVEIGNASLWKRMCRLEGCEEPAPLDGKGCLASKYCSSAHGEEYMRRSISLKSTKRRKKEQATSDQEALRPEDLKLLVEGVIDVHDFHRLGSFLPRPPTEEVDEPQIKARRNHLKRVESLALARESLVQLVEDRHREIAAEMREGDSRLKDICGYDNRLTWSDRDLEVWQKSDPGQNKLPLIGEDDSDELVARYGSTVCLKRRCDRHRGWLKTQQLETAFERQRIQTAIQRLDADKSEEYTRAALRWLE